MANLKGSETYIDAQLLEIRGGGAGGPWGFGQILGGGGFHFFAFFVIYCIFMLQFFGSYHPPPPPPLCASMKTYDYIFLF